MTAEITPTPPLPIEGWADVEMPVERMWEIFTDVPGWSSWNPCIWRSRMRGGELREGATLVWAFNPIRRRYLYKMPATAEIVEVLPAERVTWEVKAPGFHALHSYKFEAAGPDRCRFGSWEVAEGPTFRAMRRFWLAHFRYVRDESLAGARAISVLPSS